MAGEGWRRGMGEGGHRARLSARMGQVVTTIDCVLGGFLNEVEGGTGVARRPRFLLGETIVRCRWSETNDSIYAQEDIEGMQE